MLGKKDRDRGSVPMLPGEIAHIDPPNKVADRVPPGDLPPLIVLLESLVFASVFFGVPMLSKKALRDSLRKSERVLGYFACLGIAFILFEICLIQRLVLFLGAPVYSIAAVLCSLLVFAGLGSLCSGRIAPTAPSLRKLLWGVAAAVVLVHLMTPVVTRVFLGFSLPVRILASFLLTGSAGFLMGMPMPTGLRYLKAKGLPVVPWAWATNGYFTVVGSALSVVIAVNFGFTVVFLLAAATYVAAPFFLKE